jgi:lysophospholipase L1-like esterase
MHKTTPRTLIACSIVLLLALPATLRAADVRGNCESPNEFYGKGANYRLTADAQFGWRTGTLTGDIDLNGHAFVMETGGGNHTVLRGAITGRGSFEWRGGGVPQVAPSVLGGERPNTFHGPFTLSHGVLDLDKPAGVDAIPGDLVIGARGNALVRLNKSHQINDSANVTLAGPDVSGLELQGHDEELASLTLKAHAMIDMGETPASLVVGESSARLWDLTKTLTIRGFKPGKDRLVFGKDPRGLGEAQLTRIGFASPSGRPDGLYTAKIGPAGELAPDALVKPVHPPFDVSPQAAASRKKVYDVPGLARLTGADSPLRDGMTIDFFGDSITWQNGYIEMMEKAIKAGTGTRDNRVKLINRGLNGGGVLQVRDGATEGGFPGSSRQAAFAQLISADHARLAVVFIGINDVWWRNTPRDVFAKALRDLVAAAKANKTRLVLATLSAHGELPDGKNSDDPKIEQYAEITRKVARDAHVALVDLRAAYIAYLQSHNAELRVDGTLYSVPSGILTYDGVHPSSRGVDLLANQISQGIFQALTSRATD